VEAYDPDGTNHRKFFYENFDKAIYSGVPGSAVRAYQRKILKRIPAVEDGRYLELGSHALELTQQLTGRIRGFKLLAALDLAKPEQLTRSRAERLASEDNLRVELIQGDASRLPFCDESFDVVFHGCLLHHLERPLECVNEIRRVLRPGGTAVFYLPCDPGFTLRVIQRVLTQRSARRLMGSKSMSVDFLWAIEHRNHYSSLLKMIRYVCQSDTIMTFGYPIRWRFWNLKLFDVLVVNKMS